MSIPKIASYAMPQPSEFPNNKTQWQIDPSRAVLLVHDMQQYFLEFYDLSQQPIPELLQHTQQLIQAARAQNIPVVYTAQPGDQTPEHRQLLTDFWGTGLKADPEITKIHADVAPTEADIVMTKWRYSAFKFSDFEERMQAWGRDQLIVCGVYAHIGCLLSAAEAFMLNIQPFLCGDALSDFSRAEHDMALKYASQRCAQVMATQEVVQALAVTEQASEQQLGISADSILHLLSEQLEIPATEIQADDNLLLLGLDSVRLMSLVGHWQAQGAQVSFEDLAEEPTLAAWQEKLVA